MAVSTTDSVVQIAIRMAAANGFGRVIVGQGGLLSTPAASNVIRKIRRLWRHHSVGQPQSWAGQMAISASSTMLAMAAPRRKKSPRPSSPKARQIASYKTTDTADIDLDKIGTTKVEGMTVEVIDPVADYATLMQSLFDFDLPSVR